MHIYDLAGNLTQHIDNESGISYNYTYNEHNQVTEYTEKKGTSTRVKTSCTYDTYYRPMTSTYRVDGKSYSYSCGYANSLGDELSTFGTPLGTVTYTRDDLKRLKSKRYTCKNVSALQSYTYAPNRADGTYTSQLVKNLNFTVGSNVQRLSYTYDASGNITAIEDNAGAVASYEYDGLGRLTRENISGKKTVVYSYDGAGNLTSKKEYAYTTGALGAIKATHSYQYAGGTWCNRLTFYDGECIVYDSAGYPTTYRDSLLTWSSGNLTKYGNLTFAYNDAGIRIKKGTTEYIVKGNLVLAEKRGDTVIHYYYDDSGVAGFEYNGQKYFYRKNLQGDIIGIYDSCWNLLGLYEYDAWGNLLSQVSSEILNINPFRYRGYYYDAETGLYYLNSRYYDPVIGRFISPDSLKYLDPTYNNGLNLYTYCGNNPVMHVDPNGTFFGALIVGALIAGVVSGSLSAINKMLEGGTSREVWGAFFGDLITGSVLSAAAILGGGLAVGALTLTAGHLIGTAIFLSFGTFVGGALANYVESSIAGKNFDFDEAMKQGVSTMSSGVSNFVVGYIMGMTGLWDSLKPGNGFMDAIKVSRNIYLLEAGRTLTGNIASIFLGTSAYLGKNLVYMILRSIIKYIFT